MFLEENNNVTQKTKQNIPSFLPLFFLPFAHSPFAQILSYTQLANQPASLQPLRSVFWLIKREKL